MCLKEGVGSPAAPAQQTALIEKLQQDNEYLSRELAMAEGSAADLKKNVDRARELEIRLEA